MKTYLTPKNLLFAAIVAFVVVALVLSQKGGAPSIAPTAPAAANVNAPAVNAPAEATTTPTEAAAPAAKPAAPKAAAPSSYSQALDLYGKTGYRIQFVNCSATPGSIAVKKNQKFMLDNRDAVARTIAVGSAKYTLAAYGYRIVSTSQTGTVYITCNGGGSGRLTVNP